MTWIFWFIAAVTILLALSTSPRNARPVLIVVLLILLIVLGAGDT